MHNSEKRFERLYEAHMERFIPRYAFFSFIGCFALNCVVYWLTQHLMADTYHYDISLSFDSMVPFIPQWVSIYVISYLFWVVNYSLVARKSSKEYWYKFASADMLARLVCSIFFILLPTTIVRPDIVGNGFWDYAIGLIYFLDEPYNLFPSIHCLASWMCFIGIRRNRNVSTGYKVFSFIFALLICASTQFTKQHYILDVVGGIAIAEACFLITTHGKGYIKVMKLFDQLNSRAFGDSINEE